MTSNDLGTVWPLYLLIKFCIDIYSISSCLKEVGEKGDLYDDQYNNSPREGKKENENANNNEYDQRPTILGANSGLPNGGKWHGPIQLDF